MWLPHVQAPRRGRERPRSVAERRTFIFYEDRPCLIGQKLIPLIPTAIIHHNQPVWKFGGPNSACDVGLPLELTSGLGRDRGESGGLRGVLVAPARHREKLGCLFMGIVGSGCARSRIVGLGLIGSERWISRGLEGSQCRIVRLREDLWSFGQLRHWADQVRRG